MNTGVFILGVVLLALGILSDLYNYYGNLAWPLMIAGFALIIIGGLVPAVTRSTVSTDTVVPERRVKTVVRED